ncbi:MAG: hypothetical protein LBN00_04890 [Oscillospiraceae bacterium]|jgi:hypothetical protein|nr:hypothetical protein [Oscillospiraceae bacterium]
MPDATEKYEAYLDEKILPFINYGKLQISYETDLVYAKEVLTRLHKAMVRFYGSKTLSEEVSEDGFVIVPGVVCGKKSGQMCIALFSLDLSSSGEHWGTDFICDRGVVTQGDDTVPRHIAEEITARYLPYDYAYTAVIPGDIHLGYQFQRRDKSPENLFGLFKREDSVHAKIKESMKTVATVPAKPKKRGKSKPER